MNSNTQFNLSNTLRAMTLAAGLAIGLIGTPPGPAWAGFIAPQSFDFGSDEGKYQHTDDSANWQVLDGLPGSPTYQPDALRIAPTTGDFGSLGLLANFDSFGGDKRNDFTVSMEFTLVANSGASSQWNAFQLWALGTNSLATDNSDNTGYVLRIRSGDSGGEPRLALVRGGYLYTVIASDSDFPFVLGDRYKFEIDGHYGDHEGTPGLFLTASATNVTQNESVTLATYFDAEPQDGNGFGFGVRRHHSTTSATMDVHSLSVVPEPTAWLLFLVAAACGLLVRRRRGKE